MEKYLAFVTIDVWTLIFTWANLLILFLLMKKFFFKPIKNILKQRGRDKFALRKSKFVQYRG